MEQGKSILRCKNFEKCPFRIMIPEISGISDTGFDLAVQMARKPAILEEKIHEECLAISEISIEDNLGDKFTAALEDQTLLPGVAKINHVLGITFDGKISTDDLLLTYKILSKYRCFLVSYHFFRYRKGTLIEVQIKNISKKDRKIFDRLIQQNQEAHDVETTKQEQKDKAATNLSAAPSLEKYRSAVFREMYYLRDNGGRKYKITDGEFIDQRGPWYSYIFELDSELHLAEDAPITVTVAGVSIKGVAVDCENFQIIIAVSHDLGRHVSSAILSVEAWKLLEVLGKKIDSLSRSSKLSIKIAEDGPKLYTDKPADFIPKGQDKAIDHVWKHPITVIWGPPGTGKSYVMSYIALQAYQKGLSVLMVSHSNISVDGVINETAKRFREKNKKGELLKTLESGKVLRYGYVRDEELSKDENVVAFNYALRHMPQEKRRMDELNREKLRIAKTNSKRREEIERELHDIRQKVRAAEKRYASHARILATTISKVLIDPLFMDAQYDIVMFDEVSMAYVPQLIVAASYAMKKFVCVGDFYQLAPIAQSEAKKTLCTDIFTYLGINRYGHIYAHPWLVMLNEQRRMHPAISAFASQEVYHNLLKDHKDVIHGRDEIASKEPFPGSALQLIDLAGTFCAAAKNMDNSRFNILSAIVTYATARKAIQSGLNSTGIITPYAAQARLIRAMIQDDSSSKEETTLSCATVHQFQGSEREAIIFDAVESYPAKKAGVLLSSNENDAVKRLINVAVTRAKGKFITVANARFWERKFQGKPNLYFELIQYLRKNGYLTKYDKEKHLQRYMDSLDFGRNIKRYVDKECILKGLQRDFENAQGKIVVSLPEGNMGLGSPVLDLLKFAKEKNHVQIMVKAQKFPQIPDDWKPYTWESENAIFPLVEIDDTLIWYGVPELRGKFEEDASTKINTVFPVVFRIKGKHTVGMINALADIDYREVKGIRTPLTEKSEDNDKESNSTGLQDYITKYVRCGKCNRPTSLAMGHKSKKLFLRCPSCGHTDLLTRDEVNDYIERYGITCPEHHCHIYAGVSKYGLYIRCEAGHYLKPYEI